MHYDFEKDRLEGEAIEWEFANRLHQKKGESFVQLEVSTGNEPGWDVCVRNSHTQTLYEVKADLMAEKTGNFAIEFSHNDKKSGLASTKADFWVQYYQGNFYIFNTQSLKNELSLNWPFYEKRLGGDKGRTAFLLLPIRRARNFHFLEIL